MLVCKCGCVNLANFISTSSCNACLRCSRCHLSNTLSYDAGNEPVVLLQRDCVDAAAGVAGHGQALCRSQARQPHGPACHPLRDTTGKSCSRSVYKDIHTLSFCLYIWASLSTHAGHGDHRHHLQLHSPAGRGAAAPHECVCALVPRWCWDVLLAWTTLTWVGLAVV